MKYPLSSGPLNDAIHHSQNYQNVDNAIEIMKNAIKANTITHSLKAKHLFKSKIRKPQGTLNINSHLRKKNSSSKRHFKNNNRKKSKKR